MLSRRSLVVSGVAASAAILFPLPGSSAPVSTPANPLIPKGSSKSVLTAALASAIDTNARQFKSNRAAYNASAVSTSRLMSAVFENFNEVGETSREEAWLLANSETFLDYSGSPSLIAAEAQQAAASLGFNYPTSSFTLYAEATRDQRLAALKVIQQSGLNAFYRAMVIGVSNKTIDSEYRSLVPASSSQSHAHFKLVAAGCGLDGTDCGIIKIGAILCGLSGNPIGAAALGMWMVCCC